MLVTATFRFVWLRRSIHFQRIQLQRGAPSGHTIAIREIRLSAGAEFIVVVTGDIMTMPGLPKVPAANTIKLENGEVVGLF